MALILACPACKAAREYPLRTLIVCTGIAPVLLADVPFVLCAELWDIHVSALDPGRFSPLLLWRDFLQGGGRFVLRLALGVLALAAGQAATVGNPQATRALPERAMHLDYGARLFVISVD